MPTVTLLPVLQRELRVAARRSSSYWSRVIGAGAALVVAGAILSIIELSRGGFPVPPGKILFGFLKYLSFVATCFAGVFLTSDSLSEEKREGTLGLLFLTDLRGYDVVVGKLGATSLRAVYGLLAAFPILALGFLLGGVTGLEFWRVILLLCNALFLSLSAGMLVSALSRDSQKTLWGTLLVMALLVLLPYAIDLIWASWTKAPAFVPYASWVSPLLGFIEAGSGRSGTFWTNLALTQGIAWVFLGLASFLSARTWQEQTRDTPVLSRHPDAATVPGTTVRRAQASDINPVRSLSAKRHWLASLVRWLVLIGSVGFLSFGLTYAQSAYMIGSSILSILSFLLMLAIASQASGFFVETKRAGFLELMLITPLSVRDIIAGHWWALRRIFLFPVLVLMAMTGVTSFLLMVDYLGMTATAGPTMSGVITMQIISGVSGLVSLLIGSVALARFGMWMGLTCSKPHIAVIKTLVFVKVLPWFALVMLQMTLSIALAARTQIFWLGPAGSAICGLAIDVTFVVLSHRMVHRNLRAWAAGEHRAPSLPPPLPPAGQKTGASHPGR